MQQEAFSSNVLRKISSHRCELTDRGKYNLKCIRTGGKHPVYKHINVKLDYAFRVSTYSEIGEDMKGPGFLSSAGKVVLAEVLSCSNHMRLLRPSSQSPLPRLGQTWTAK